MIYHGPTEGAEPYFGRLDYKLPKGESVADWLIDISSGRLEPDNPVALNRKESMKKFKKANRKKTRNLTVALNETLEEETYADDDDPFDKSAKSSLSVDSEEIQELHSDPASTGSKINSSKSLTADESTRRLKSAYGVIIDDNCVGKKGVTTGKVVR